MTEAVLRFPGQVPDTAQRLEVRPGGCELGDRRCTQAPELEVTVPDLGSVRLLCRDHVGYFMLAAAGTEHAIRVLVRRLGPAEANGWARRRLA